MSIILNAINVLLTTITKKSKLNKKIDGIKDYKPPFVIELDLTKILKEMHFIIQNKIN